MKWKILIAAALMACSFPALSAEEKPFIGGVCVHVIDNPDQQDSQLDLAKRIGFSSVRADVFWKKAEKVKGKIQIPEEWDRFVNHALERGLQPLLIIDYGNPFYDNGGKPRSKEAVAAYVRYASEIVRHFHGRVHYFEIWNEWNTHLGNTVAGTAEDYATLFKATYPALKKIAPEATFIAGAGDQLDWVEQLARVGVVDIADGVAVHPYNYQTAGNDGPEILIRDLQAMQVKARELSKKDMIDFYVTEIGWPTNTGRWGRSENEVAEIASKSLLLSAQLPYVKGVWWYVLKDDGPNIKEKQFNFGLSRYDSTPKSTVIDAISRALKRIE